MKFNVFKRKTPERKIPKKIIEGAEKGQESVYLKFPGEDIIDVSAKADSRNVVMDGEKIKRLLKKYKSDSFSYLHTHPSKNYAAFPGTNDLNSFLKTKQIKTMFIAQRDDESGEVQGYFVLKKTKETPVETIFLTELAIDHYKNRTIGRIPLEGLKELSEEYKLLYRHVPSRGYKLDAKSRNSSFKFIENTNLETKVTSIIVVSALTLIFLSPHLTGNAITNLTAKISSIIGAILFFIGIVGLYFWFKKR